MRVATGERTLPLIRLAVRHPRYFANCLAAGVHLGLASANDLRL